MDLSLPDIQDSFDERGLSIDDVGICGLRYPITFRDGDLTQLGIATVEMSVGLAAHRRGTHMSRMVQIADSVLQDFNPRELAIHLKLAAGTLEADSVVLAVAFPIGLEVTAPQSRLVSTQVHDVEVRASLRNGVSQVITSVTSDITSLCPCSRAVSDYGAHNQRSIVTVSVHGDDADPYPVTVRRLVELIRSKGSAPVLPLVKRSDERHLTMQAHDNPAFVEDIVRDISAALRTDAVRHELRSRNVESIHSHDAFASLAWRPE